MSEVSTVSDRFWREMKSDVSGSLSAEQRGEIERALDASSVPADKELGDVRMSFKWFFVRLVWGPEKRNAERLADERAVHPVMARRNLPMLASLFAGYVTFLYVLLAVTAVGLTYLVF